MIVGKTLPVSGAGPETARIQGGGADPDEAVPAAGPEALAIAIATAPKSSSPAKAGRLKRNQAKAAQPCRFFLKKSIVRCQARAAASSL